MVTSRRAAAHAFARFTHTRSAPPPLKPPMTMVTRMTSVREGNAGADGHDALDAGGIEQSFSAWSNSSMSISLSGHRRHHLQHHSRARGEGERGEGRARGPRRDADAR